MASLADIRARLAAQENKASGSTFQGDNAIFPHWNINEGDTATVRFLPDGDTSNPFFWIELHGIESRSEFFILLDRDLGGGEDPFGMAGLSFPFSGRDGIQPPMDEKPEPGFPPPGHPFVLFPFRFFFPRLRFLCGIGRSFCRFFA